MSLYIPFYFNIAFLDSSLEELNTEVKVVRSLRRAIIWLSFLFDFGVEGTGINFEEMGLWDKEKVCS